MTHDVLVTAIRERIPFSIQMADGREYKVENEYKIALGTTRVVVLDEKDLPHVLPLLTMTGVSYLETENGAGAA